MQGRGGTRPLSRVKLGKGRPIPEIGDVILVLRDGSEYYCIDIVERERETDLERNAAEQLVPGDMAMGDPEEGTGVGLRRGGMAILKADMMTGIVANKIIGIVQTLGKRFSWDTNLYHKLIRTLSDKRNTIIDTKLSGSPRNSPLTLEMLKSIIDTSDGSIVIDLSGFDDCDIKFKFAPQALQTRGTNISIENETPLGTAKWGIDGTTGKVSMESPVLVKVDAPFIQLNSSGLPTEKVLRIGDVVPGPNGGVITGIGSNTVFIG
jgi:hypothetical protein